jgi:hypothetical protein
MRIDTRTALCLLIAATLTAAGGCDGPPPPVQTQAPKPLDMLLPTEIRIHPFTGTRTFDEAGGIRGVEVRMEAVNAFGESTNAFGIFTFQLYSFRNDSADHRGELINSWEQSIMEPQVNAVHWDHITRSYLFKLQWYRGIPVGRRLVLVASFTSPYTPRLGAQHVFVAGQ